MALQLLRCVDNEHGLHVRCIFSSVQFCIAICFHVATARIFCAVHEVVFIVVHARTRPNRLTTHTPNSLKKKLLSVGINMNNKNVENIMLDFLFFQYVNMYSCLYFWTSCWTHIQRLSPSSLSLIHTYNYIRTHARTQKHINLFESSRFTTRFIEAIFLYYCFPPDKHQDQAIRTHPSCEVLWGCE